MQRTYDTTCFGGRCLVTAAALAGSGSSYVLRGQVDVALAGCFVQDAAEVLGARVAALFGSRAHPGLDPAATADVRVGAVLRRALAFARLLVKRAQQRRRVLDAHIADVADGPLLAELARHDVALAVDGHVTLPHRARGEKRQALEPFAHVHAALDELLGDIGDRRGYRADVVFQVALRIKHVVNDEVAKLAPLLFADAQRLLAFAAPACDQVADVEDATVQILGDLDHVEDRIPVIDRDGRLEHHADVIGAQDAHGVHDLVIGARHLGQLVVVLARTVQRRCDPLHAVLFESQRVILVDQCAVGRDRRVDAALMDALQDLPEVLAQHRLATRKKDDRAARRVHAVDQLDSLLIAELVRQDVRVGRHVAVAALQVATIGDIPNQA